MCVLQGGSSDLAVCSLSRNLTVKSMPMEPTRSNAIPSLTIYGPDLVT